MATKAHKLLTGTDLHEPKGVETALAGTAYIANGAGSGTWTPINTAVQFSTGDTKWTYKSVTDAGWILVNTNLFTIGNAASGATYAAADAQGLYVLLWNNITPGSNIIVGGRGGSALADFNANKKMQAWNYQAGTVFAAAGASVFGATYALGAWQGAETTVLTNAQMPLHSHGGATGTESGLHNHNVTIYSALQTVRGQSTGDSFWFNTWTGTTGVTSGTENQTHTHVISPDGNNQPHTNFQPTTYMNLMVKL